MKTGVFGVACAAVLFPWVFRSKRGSFWARMPIVSGFLGFLALLARPELRRQSPNPSDILTGLLTAAGLYRVFQIGDRLARRLMPRGDDEIAGIYALRQGAPSWLIAVLLAGIIAPCEELFWRGLLQNSLTKRLGRWRGAAVASACYGLVHLGSGNLTLSGAAGTAGALWGIQYALQDRLPALIVSHLVWDIWIFLVAPTGRDRADRMTSS